jgi:hypothetical protein
MIRFVRIVGLATILAFLFRLSAQAAIARGNENVPGYSIALAIVTALFFVRAIATEYTGKVTSTKPVPDQQKDVLWGITLGTFVALLARVLH